MHQDHTHITLKTPKHTNHVLHLVLTMATCGAWGFVWVGVVFYNAVMKDKTTVQSAWYGQPIAKPYAVGPGEPVGSLNPHPPTLGVPMRPMPPYVGYGPSRDVVNMANRPSVYPEPGQPGDMLYCDLGDCDYRTAYAARMQMHRSLPHRPRPQ